MECNGGIKMRYKTKSIIISRLKRESADEEYGKRPCRITLHDRNNPQTSEEEPEAVLEFKGVEKVVLKNLEVNYLTSGNDLVVNDLEEISITKDNGHLTIEPISKKGFDIGE